MSRFTRTKIKNEKGLYRRAGAVEAFVFFHGKTYSAGTHETIQKAKHAQARRLSELEQRAKEARRLTPDSKVVFRVYVDDWKLRKFPDFKPSMQRTADSHLSKHLLPMFGGMRLRDITPHLLETKAAEIGPQLAPKGRKNILRTLIGVLRDAHKMDFLARDVTEHFQFPKVERKQITAVPIETVRSIIESMASPYREVCLLAAATGMRQGEVLALAWKDVDFEAATIRIARARDQATGIEITPKTEAGVRTIEVSHDVITFLASWQSTQEQRWTARRVAQASKLRRYAKGTDRHEAATKALARMATLDATYVFPVLPAAKRRTGRMPVVEPRNVLRAFVDAAADLGITMRYHDLRHTFASTVLALGGYGALHTLANQLGHKKPSFTSDQYGHMIPGRAKAIIQPVSSALFPQRSAGLDLARDLAQAGRSAAVGGLEVRS